MHGIVLGAMLANSMGVIGGGLHIATHAAGKITLFFCAGAIMVAAHKTKVSELSGLGRKMPFTFAFFFIGALSIIGLPPTGGMWSKWYLALATLEAGNYVLLGVLLLSSLLAVGYLMPVVVRGFFGAKPSEGHGGAGAEIAEGAVPKRATVIEEAPLPMLIAMAITAVLSIVLFFAPGPVIALIASLFPEWSL